MSKNRLIQKCAEPTALDSGKGAIYGLKPICTKLNRTYGS